MQRAFDDIEGLPQILTEARLGSLMNVRANGLGRMSTEITVPKPTARDGEKAIWMEASVKDWFSTLQPTQSAYASIDPGLGQVELEDMGIYVCPARDSAFIGQRRPVKLALYRSKQPKNSQGNSVVDVYTVSWVQTQDGVMGEELAYLAGSPKPQPISWDLIRPGDDTLHTVFKLDLASHQTLDIGRAWQRGGTVSTESLQSALKKGYSSHFQGGLAH